ncbi:MAG: TonB-dependent receptor [Candidatus Marinimicrobia bacterium]|nr:TonB-dependent receptor [Candidatus Neomarinimicrobiota bacterium]
MKFTQSTIWNNSLPILILLLITSISFSDTISGIVTDISGNPISNVNIYNQNTGTHSDENGQFRLDMKNDILLTFSHIGFESIQLKSDSKMVIILKTSNLLGKDVYVNSSLEQRDLYNTPASVTLFNSKDLSIKSDVHLQGLIEQIPNLNYSSGTSRPRYFQIRGIGERSHYAGEGPPNYSVGFLMDGIDFSGIGMLGHLFDVNQIEIFKGPQSTVFGPNAMAGSINIITKNPTPFFNGTFESNFSTDNGKTYSGAFGGPLLRTLSFRVAGTQHSQNGFRENIFVNKNNTNGKDESFIRTKFHWKPLNNLSLSFTNLNSKLNNKYDAWAPDNNEDFITYTNQQGMDSQETNANAVKVNLPEFLEFNTVYKFSNSNSEMVHSYDGDWGNDSLWLIEYGFDPDVEGWNYEFWDETNRRKNTSSNEITFYSSDNLNLPLNGSFISGFYLSITSQTDEATGWLFGGDATHLSSEFKIQSTAIYSNYNAKISESSELNTNFRFENHQIDYFANAENFYNSYYYMDTNLPVIDTSKTDNFIGLNISFRNQISKKLLVYASIAKGYKAGGINQHPYLNMNSRFYNPEYNLNFEIGGRLTWKKAKMNFAIFNMKRTDLQVQISSQQVENDPNSFTYFTSNASSGYNSGFELETTIEILACLKLNYSMGYLKTHVNEFSYPVGYAVDDSTFTNPVMESSGNREQAMAPNFNNSLNLYYNHNSGLFINGNITSKDDYYFSDSHDEKSNRYSLVNMNIGFHKNNFTISIWGKNITDQRYAVRGFYFGLEPPNYEDKLYLSYGNPREIGIKLSYQF